MARCGAGLLAPEPAGGLALGRVGEEDTRWRGVVGLGVGPVRLATLSLDRSLGCGLGSASGLGGGSGLGHTAPRTEGVESVVVVEVAMQGVDASGLSVGAGKAEVGDSGAALMLEKARPGGSNRHVSREVGLACSPFGAKTA